MPRLNKKIGTYQQPWSGNNTGIRTLVYKTMLLLLLLLSRFSHVRLCVTP